MSKKTVSIALSAYRDGRITDCAALLADVDGQFVAKRLGHLVGEDRLDARDANIIWQTSFPDAPQPLVDDAHMADRDPADTAPVLTPPSPPSERFAPSPDLIDASTRPGEFLSWLSTQPPNHPISLDALRMIDMGGLVALATLARAPEPDLSLQASATSPSGGFALAVGLDEVVSNQPRRFAGEADRTVPLQRVVRFPEIEPTAHDIAALLVPTHQTHSERSTRQTLQHVIVELLRNVVQHSRDNKGGVVAAQVMRPHDREPSIEVAVGDAGVGIFASLRRTHPDLPDERTALLRALDPHYSGAFEDGLTGSGENAGLGLFFIAEMTKLLGGSMLLASRGAALMLTADASPQIAYLDGGTFAGTLVVFRIPDRALSDYDELTRIINAKAKQFTPKRATGHWLVYATPPDSVNPRNYVVRLFAEDTAAAVEKSLKEFVPALIDKRPIALNFAGMEIATQSFLHALLYEALRVGWATRTRIYIVNAATPVKSSLDLLEAYALGG